MSYRLLVRMHTTRRPVQHGALELRLSAETAAGLLDLTEAPPGKIDLGRPGILKREALRGIARARDFANENPATTYNTLVLPASLLGHAARIRCTAHVESGERMPFLPSDSRARRRLRFFADSGVSWTSNLIVPGQIATLLLVCAPDDRVPQAFARCAQVAMTLAHTFLVGGLRMPDGSLRDIAPLLAPADLAPLLESGALPFRTMSTSAIAALSRTKRP